jgi:predicted nucleic acid-binding protein
MRIIVSDTSCLIDLRKASLLEALIQLPYEIGIPDVLFEELVNFKPTEIALIEEHFKKMSLPGEGVLRVQAIASQHSALSLNDCFAFVVAERITDSILLTGDRRLRNLATAHQIEVHGVLWALDEMLQAKAAKLSQLYKALQLFQNDPTVLLPSNEVNARLKRYGELMNPES